MSSFILNNPSGDPINVLITPGIARPENFPKSKYSIMEMAEFAAGSDVKFIQIREKMLPVKLLVELADEVVRICGNGSTRVLINERFDVAVTVRAAGVHLTSTSIPVEKIRALSHPGFLIGASVHTPMEALSAANNGADYVMFGPIFETPSKKKYGKPQGKRALREVCEILEGFPVIAVGGIGGDRIDDVMDAGAAGFAAIRFFSDR